MYGDQDSYTKPVYTKLKAGESSMLAEVPLAGAVWSVRCTAEAQSYVMLTVLMVLPLPYNIISALFLNVEADLRTKFLVGVL